MNRDKHQFAIGGLPHQEIRETLFAAGADDQIGVRNIRRIEVTAERIGGDRRRIALALRDFAREPLRRVGDFLPRSVVEGHDKRETRVVSRQFLGFVEQRADVGLKSLAFADNANPHTIGMQRRKIVADEAAQQAEQIADLARGP